MPKRIWTGSERMTEKATVSVFFISRSLYKVILNNMSNLNDPRVLFAAERTLFAWNRTSLSLMAFGFVIERFFVKAHIGQTDC